MDQVADGTGHQMIRSPSHIDEKTPCPSPQSTSWTASHSGSGGEAIAVTAVRQVAGKNEWAGSVIPFLKAMIRPLWAAVTGDGSTHVVGTRRVAHALRWLQPYSRRLRGRFHGQYVLGDRHAVGILALQFDASRWALEGSCIRVESRRRGTHHSRTRADLDPCLSAHVGCLAEKSKCAATLKQRWR